MRITLVILLLFGLFSCETKNNQRQINDSYLGFKKIDRHDSKLNFKNNFKQDLTFNFMNYPNIMSGAGVAIGDIDNDGLMDIYIVANFENNKLYKNEGDLKFKDISATSNTNDFDGFSTGVNMFDVNNDGFLDIYVCKAGSLRDNEGRRNKLFVNQKNGTFKEEAKKWGLDDPGYSTQAYQLDYDMDGDLDLFIVNHRYDTQNITKISTTVQNNIEETTSDQLYRNDGNIFVKITAAAGLHNKSWGLSASIGDFNEDGSPDIYVANDFLEPDNLYINQNDGTFKDEALNYLKHISFYSMGSDFADINNDLLPDLISLDMMAENYARSKENMATMSISDFNSMVDVGYNHAYMGNMLNLNRGDGKFQEFGQLAGITKTDWSWSPLIADFNNDGYKDIFVSNGVIRDHTNKDFKTNISKITSKGQRMTIDQLFDLIPSQKLQNYLYLNQKNLSFVNVSDSLGLKEKTFSNGAAYADLDNDGDLDMVLNNHEDYMSLYENKASKNYLKIKLKGSDKNRFAIGTSVVVTTKEGQQEQTLYNARGYESSTSHDLVFGLDTQNIIEKIDITWPDGFVTLLQNIEINNTLTVDYNAATKSRQNKRLYNSSFKEVNMEAIGVKYRHIEDSFDDYESQLLLPHKKSTLGTNIVVSDFNMDGKEDFFIGNAHNTPAKLYIQNTTGSFNSMSESIWESDKVYEDGDAVAIDIEGDGDMDLIVTSAGYQFEGKSGLLSDRIYLNDGTGNFKKSTARLPYGNASTKSITAGDIDGDGDDDLFVGGSVKPGKYPLSNNSFILRNDNGKFIDVSSTYLKDQNFGLVSDAEFKDLDGDNDLDLVVVGEWTGVQLLDNENNTFVRVASNLNELKGWWQELELDDIDGDGDVDVLVGNIGGNNKFKPSIEKPIYIYSKDFDSNGSYDVALTKMNNGKMVPVRGKECSSQQNPFLLDDIKSYKQFSNLEFKDIYGEERLAGSNKLKATIFESVYLENFGDFNFKMTPLNSIAQMGPTNSFIKITEGGDARFIGAGALYDAEVETIKYDGNYGYQLKLGQTKELNAQWEGSPVLDYDIRDLACITVNEKKMILVLCNNDILRGIEYEE